jgi:hypothetical protein
MTVIAWDGKTLAADRRMCSGSIVQSTTKLFHVISHEQEPCLVAVTGDFSMGMEMVDWFADGAKPSEFRSDWRDPDKGGACMLVVRKSGVVQYESSPVPIQFTGPFCASGSGSMAALAAMHCGKSAAEAVEIASIYCSGCGNGVDTLEL